MQKVLRRKGERHPFNLGKVNYKASFKKRMLEQTLIILQHVLQFKQPSFQQCIKSLDGAKESFKLKEVRKTCHCKNLTKIIVHTSNINMASLGLRCFQQTQEESQTT